MSTSGARMRPHMRPSPPTPKPRKSNRAGSPRRSHERANRGNPEATARQSRHPSEADAEILRRHLVTHRMRQAMERRFDQGDRDPLTRTAVAGRMVAAALRDQPEWVAVPACEAVGVELLRL